MKWTELLPKDRSVLGLRKWSWSQVQVVSVELYRITAWTSLDMELCLQIAWCGQRVPCSSTAAGKDGNVRDKVGSGAMVVCLHTRMELGAVPLFTHLNLTANEWGLIFPFYRTRREQRLRWSNWPTHPCMVPWIYLVNSFLITVTRINTFILLSGIDTSSLWHITSYLLLCKIATIWQNRGNNA